MKTNHTVNIRYGAGPMAYYVPRGGALVLEGRGGGWGTISKQAPWFCNALRYFFFSFHRNWDLRAAITVNRNQKAHDIHPWWNLIVRVADWTTVVLRLYNVIAWDLRQSICDSDKSCLQSNKQTRSWKVFCGSYALVEACQRLINEVELNWRSLLHQAFTKDNSS